MQIAFCKPATEIYVHYGCVNRIFQLCFNCNGSVAVFFRFQGPMRKILVTMHSRKRGLMNRHLVLKNKVAGDSFAYEITHIQ